MLVTSSMVEVAAGRAHQAFVLDSFWHSLTDAGTPYASGHVALLERDLRGGLARTVVAVPVGHPETFLGWASAVDGVLLFAYVPRHMRGVGIARQLMADILRPGPVRLAYWTGAAQRAQERGFPLIQDWPEFHRRQRLIDRVRRRSLQHERSTA